MNQVNSNLFIQCPREQRAKLKNVSVKLQVSESALVRAALREGLKIVLKRGIRLDGAEEGELCKHDQPKPNEVKIEEAREDAR